MREKFLLILKFLKPFDGDMKFYRIDNLIDGLSKEETRELIYLMRDKNLIHYDDQTIFYLDEPGGTKELNILGRITDVGSDYLDANSFEPPPPISPVGFKK